MIFRVHIGSPGPGQQRLGSAAGHLFPDQSRVISTNLDLKTVKTVSTSFACSTSPATRPQSAAPELLDAATTRNHTRCRMTGIIQSDDERPVGSLGPAGRRSPCRRSRSDREAFDAGHSSFVYPDKSGQPPSPPSPTWLIINDFQPDTFQLSG